MIEPDIQRTALRYKLISTLAGLLLGLICILVGALLFLLGVAGSSSWTAKFLGLQSSMTDAAPGAILFVVGFLIVYVTRFSIKIETTGHGSVISTLLQLTKPPF